MELVAEVTKCKVDLRSLTNAVEDVVDYYKAVLARDPTNPAAPERLQFFSDLLDLLKKECR